MSNDSALPVWWMLHGLVFQYPECYTDLFFSIHVPESQVWKHINRALGSVNDTTPKAETELGKRILSLV